MDAAISPGLGQPVTGRVRGVVCFVAAFLLLLVSALTVQAADSTKMLRTRYVLQNLADALECYFDEYGVYPPVGNCVQYEYENPTNQSYWFRTFLAQHNNPADTNGASGTCFWTDRGEGCGIAQEPHMYGELGYTGRPEYPAGWHLHYRYGLVAHLDYRQRNQAHWYDKDTARDVAAKSGWHHYMYGLTGWGGDRAHDVSVWLGTPCVFSNRIDTLRDGFGGEIKFESYAPWTRYKAWAETPEGVVTVYSRPVPDPSNLVAAAQYELDEIERAIQDQKCKGGPYWPTDQFQKYFVPWTSFESQDPDPWGNNYRYTSMGLSYRLWSAGSDGVDGTEDDVFPPGTQRFRECVNARQVVLKALTNAIADVDADLGSLPAPSWTTFGSTGTSVLAKELLDDEHYRHIPGARWSDTLSTMKTWVGGQFPSGDYYRYAYLVVDCSGFPDANHIGGAARNRGLGPDELSLDALSSIADTNLFLQLRWDHTRYETLDEMAALQGGLGLLTNEPPENLVTYSHFPAGHLAGGTGSTDIVSLQGDASDLIARQASIRQALQNSGLSPSEAIFAYLNLIDYVDADLLPRNANGTTASRLDWPCVEAVPMLNEVWCRGAFNFTTNAGGGFDCEGNYRLKVECAYPFVYPAFPEGFTCGVEVSSSDPLFSPSTNPYSNEWSIVTNSAYWQRTIITSALSFGPVHVGDLTPGQVINVDVEVDGAVKWGADHVDAIITPLTLNLAVEIPDPLTASFIVLTEAGLECIDCRLNHSASEWAESPVAGDGTVPGSFGAVNYATTNAMAGNPSLDQDQWQFVRNGPLEQVGELGHLFFGESLQTIRLYDHGTNGTRHTVMDRFCMATNPLAPRNGLINPNGAQSAVLAAAFTNMPLREYRSGGGIARLTAASDMNDIAAAIMAGGPYTNLSDLGSVDWGQVASGLSVTPTDPALCELDKEAFIRNAAGMFGTRQNLFVILLAGGPMRFNQGIAATIPNFLALQRAIAVVWRDPYPDATGKHESKVLFFKWLTREESYSGGIDAVDKLAGELSEATVDTVLPCVMDHDTNAITFVSLSSETYTSSNRAARRVSYYLTNGCVWRDEWRAYTNAAYPTYSLYSSDCLSSNVVTFNIGTSDGLDHTTNLPQWVSIRMEVQNQARVTRRVPLWSDFFGNCSWASNDFEYAFVQQFEDHLGYTFSNSVTWLPIGTVTQTVAAPADLMIGGTNCSFWHWVVDDREMRIYPWNQGENPIENIMMDSCHLATAYYYLPPEKLVVRSLVPYVWPPVGTNEYLTGAQVECLLGSTSSSGGPGIRYLYTNWAGTGSVPPTGSGTVVNFTITNDSSITWNWTTQYRFSVSAGPGGLVSGDLTDWYPVGATMTVTGVPNAYYSWLRWTGSVVTAANPLTLTNDSVMSILASFRENLATNDTPEWWLAQFGWTTNFDSAAMEDQDSDGMLTWEEYHADTTPTLSSSLLAITAIERTNGDLRIRWKGGAAARQYVERRQDLLSTSELWQAIYTNEPTTPITNSITDANATNGPLFYRIRAHRP